MDVPIFDDFLWTKRSPQVKGLGQKHDKHGVVHPRGWGYVPVAMCLISLSLSLSCSWFGTILMYRELCYYSWILWYSPLYLLVMDWVFPLKLSYRIESLRIGEHFMYVLHVLICGDNGIFKWSTWCMFWWSTCGFSDLVNLCIGVGTRFRLDSLIETLGHSLKFFVLVE